MRTCTEDLWDIYKYSRNKDDADSRGVDLEITLAKKERELKRQGLIADTDSPTPAVLHISRLAGTTWAQTAKLNNRERHKWLKTH